MSNGPLHMLSRPRWIVGHVLVLGLSILFVFLGMWQLQRLEERRTENLVDEQRLSAAPEPVEQLISAAGDDLDSLELRRGEATGAYIPEEQVLLRSQVREGRAGYEVITPLLLDSSEAVLVNRGWVPLEVGDGDPASYAPEDGGVTVVAPLVPSQEPTSTSREEPAGVLDVVSRVDVERIGEQVEAELLPLYLEIQGEDRARMPVPAPPPNTADEGPHLNYAIQWFAFAVIGTVGYGLLIRRAIARDADDP